MKGSASLATAPPTKAPTANAEIIPNNPYNQQHHQQQVEQFYPSPEPAKPSRPTKPILKHRTVERADRSQGMDGNWYTNPLSCSYYPANNYQQVSQTFIFLSSLFLWYS